MAVQSRLCRTWSETPKIGFLITRLISDGEGDGGGDDGDKKKRQTRGGKGGVKVKKKAEPVGISIATAKRGKKKTVTIVMGLGSYGKTFHNNTSVHVLDFKGMERISLIYSNILDKDIINFKN